VIAPPVVRPMSRSPPRWADSSPLAP
jgi:hypothetical protein